MRKYSAFWPFYVRQHSRPGTRLLHFIGTSAALALIALAAAAARPWIILAAPLSGYFFAWIGHFLVEKNRPATFTHPFFSLVGDFHMYTLMWLGRMDDEVARRSRETPPADGDGSTPE